jgi:O-antigen ligase
VPAIRARSQRERDITMTETLRYRRGVSFSAIAHAALARVRRWRIGHVLRWSIAILLIGMLTGAMAVILPPMASIGLVAIVGAVLLWATPELHVVPERLLRKLFFIMVFVQLCVPAYYAIDIPGLPWISLRRLFAGGVILLFAITVAGSKSARDKISDTIGNNRFLAFLSFGFLAMLVASVLTAAYPVRSLSALTDSFLTWYVPLLACILVVRTNEDVILLLKIIAAAGIMDAATGFIEVLVQRRYYFDIFPKSMLESMFASNPNLEIIYNTVWTRNGIYRASSIYTVPLSFGEFAAMVAPIGAYFVFHAQSMKWRVLGALTVSASLVSLVISGSRGGFLAFLIAMPILLSVWTIRYSKINRGSLVGVIMGALFMMGTLATTVLVFAWPRLHNMVLGGGETAGSTDARFVQWKMAIPHILSNPVTGHGRGSSGELIGYYNPGNPIPSVDSYLISLLVEQGVTGFLLFFGMIAFGVWTGIRLYTRNLDDRAAVGGAIACSLVAFGVYRLALSQTENHTLMFLIIGALFAVGTLSRNWRNEPSCMSSGLRYPPLLHNQPSHAAALENFFHQFPRNPGPGYPPLGHQTRKRLQ